MLRVDVLSVNACVLDLAVECFIMDETQCGLMGYYMCLFLRHLRDNRGDSGVFHRDHDGERPEAGTWREALFYEYIAKIYCLWYNICRLLERECSRHVGDGSCPIGNGLKKP
jgi:hypothetical protein